MRKSFAPSLCLFTISLLCGFVSPDAFPIETVRVDVANGAPRLMVDGTPVRARIFFGRSGIRPFDPDPLAPEGRQVAFDFSPGDDAKNSGTMHFRFEHRPGDIYLDDIRITDMDTGADILPFCDFNGKNDDWKKSWKCWPPAGPQNAVGTIQIADGKGREGSPALHIKLQAPPDGKWPDFHLLSAVNLPLQKNHRYHVSFWGRAEPGGKLDIAFYRTGNPCVNLAPDVLPQQIKLAAAAGIDFVSFPLPLFWPKPGSEPDWTGIDADCQTVLNANPDALLLPRISSYAPEWWLRDHPDECMVWDKPNPGGTMFNVASTLYRREAGKYLSLLITHLEEKFGPHMAGYHICGQNTGEWFYHETWSTYLNGYAGCDLRAWREWLAKRYGNNAALQAAWHDPEASLDSAAVPSPAVRRAASAGVLRDPATEQPVIDFGEFQQESIADCICELARTAREASGGRKLVLFFYGYLFEFSNCRNGPATSGHYALRRVLDSPDIDILCSPISYFDRGLGGNAPSMTAAESVALAGKMYLEEDDTATYLSSGDFPGWMEKVDTVEKTNQELVRNTSQCALRNFATWWMDLGATGWFNDPRMWEEMARLKPLDRYFLDHPTPYRPDVAAVIDEQSLLRVAYGPQAATINGIYGVRRPLGRMGCPFGQYLLDDVAGGKVHAKLYVFLDAWHLSPGQGEKLLENTRGATRIWCYAPGYPDDGNPSLEEMEKLTGFRMKKISQVAAMALPADAGKKLGLHTPLGIGKVMEPLFAVKDATPEETLATYPDGSVAIAMRRTADGISLFVGPPGLSSELLRLAADQSKIHIFTRTDCNVYANGPFLVLHGSQDGSLVVDTGTPAPLFDAMSGENVGNGPLWPVTLKKGETRVLQIGTIPFYSSNRQTACSSSHGNGRDRRTALFATGIMTKFFNRQQESPGSHPPVFSRITGELFPEK